MGLDLDRSFGQLVEHLEHGGRRAIDDTANDPEFARTTVSMYIWLVNRCHRGSKLTERGGVQATLHPDAWQRLADIRAREVVTLTAIADLLGTVGMEDFACRDFRTTCDLAAPSDIVFMDCPFPKFTNAVPGGFVTNPETFGTVSAGTYGTGNDGSAFQTAIVDAARELVQRGTTVLLCNFANPGLVQAYARLLGPLPGGAAPRHYTYTYRSPTTTSEAYQLTVLPGRGNRTVALSPKPILTDWVRAGGDNPLSEEFFRREDVFAMTDDETDIRHARREERRQARDSDYEVSGNEDDTMDDSIV
ncbi:hypothetical protein [Kitasatospora sp. NPDC090091]|uniref:hypothetical protein n=1 Tax=Kitasatospora sp. NPDC090091 TaxID=3364081 RepID=UPI00380D17DC